MNIIESMQKFFRSCPFVFIHISQMKVDSQKLAQPQQVGALCDLHMQIQRVVSGK